MIQESRLRFLANEFPEIEIGKRDFFEKRWRDYPGMRRSFAYELGRMLARAEIQPVKGMGGFVTLPGDIETAMNELSRFPPDEDKHAATADARDPIRPRNGRRI